MTFDHQSFALKVQIVEAFAVGSVAVFAPAALDAFVGPLPKYAAFNLTGIGAITFALALFFALRPEPLSRDHVKKNGSRVALVWNLLRLLVILPAYLSGTYDNLFFHVVWTSAKLLYVTYAVYGEHLFGRVSLPAFGSDPTELPAKRTRRAPAKLDADDAAAAADDDSYTAAAPASRSKSPARATRSTPARRAAATPRK